MNAMDHRLPYRLFALLLVFSLVKSDRAEVKPQNNGVKALREAIWTGKSAGKFIMWTTADLEIQDSNRKEEFWSQLVRHDFMNFAASAQEKVNGRPNVDDCNYQRSFALLSVVGSLVNFKDDYYVDCGGAHPAIYSRFTAVELANRSAPVYSGNNQEDGPLHVDLTRSTRAVKLTDYFPESEVLDALSGDPLIKTVLFGRPTSIEQFNKSLADKKLIIASCSFHLNLDFLTRFVFHHVEDMRVAVRISLSPVGSACQTQMAQLGLLLPIPEKLRDSFALAVLRKEGFLSVDAKKISRGKITHFEFKTGKGIIHMGPMGAPLPR